MAIISFSTVKVTRNYHQELPGRRLILQCDLNLEKKTNGIGLRNF